MWLHYLKMCFRAMARQRFLSAINLVGLAAGLASVILIFVHVSAELSYDGWLARPERLYRIDTVETVPGQEPKSRSMAWHRDRRLTGGFRIPEPLGHPNIAA